MKNRILAVFLVLTMVLGMVPVAASAEEISGQEIAGSIYRAAHAPSVAVDGVLIFIPSVISLINSPLVTGASGLKVPSVYPNITP